MERLEMMSQDGELGEGKKTTAGSCSEIEEIPWYESFGKNESAKGITDDGKHERVKRSSDDRRDERSKGSTDVGRTIRVPQQEVRKKQEDIERVSQNELPKVEPVAVSVGEKEKNVYSVMKEGNVRPVRRRRFHLDLSSAVFLVGVLIALCYAVNVRVEKWQEEKRYEELHQKWVSGSSVKYKVEYEINMISYRSVGRDLIYRTYLNGKEIKNGDIVWFSRENGDFYMETIIVEWDSYISDRSSVHSEGSMNDYINGYEASGTITLSEVGGWSNAGATATFEVKHKITPCFE